MSAVLLEGAAEAIPRPPPVIRTILLATDLSPSALDAALYAMELASQLGAQLVIASVIDVVVPIAALGQRVDQIRADREAALQALVARARGAGARATFLVWQGDPGPTIVSAAEAERADLIVIGTHGREGVTRLLLGSVSDHVVRHARCPVLVVRGHSTVA
jgi:nucleotide-binding universal stress UspA family protein